MTTIVQLAHVGSIAFDVMFFICSALSGKDRMAKTEELLQYFYNILVEKTEGTLKMSYEQVRRVTVLQGRAGNF